MTFYSKKQIRCHLCVDRHIDMSYKYLYLDPFRFHIVEILDKKKCYLRFSQNLRVVQQRLDDIKNAK